MHFVFVTVSNYNHFTNYSKIKSCKYIFLTYLGTCRTLCFITSDISLFSKKNKDLSENKIHVLSPVLGKAWGKQTKHILLKEIISTNTKDVKDVLDVLKYI